MRGARERLAIDGGNFSGVRTIDGHEDDAARRGAVQARVNNYIRNIAGIRLERGVAEAGAGAIETAEGSESRQRVGVGAVRRPEAGGENALGSKNSKVVGLRDGSGDVVPATALVLRNGNFHAGVFGVDLGLEAAEDVDGCAAQFLVNPRVAVSTVGERGIPEVARTLNDELDLRVGESRAGEIQDARAVRIVILRVPMEVVDVH